MRKPRLPEIHANFDATDVTSSRALEPEILERFRGAPVEGGCTTIVATPLRKVALCDPCRGSMRARRELREGILRLREHLRRLVQPSLLEQRAAENEAGVPDLVQPVFACAEQGEGVPSVLLRDRRIAGAQVRLRERRHGCRGLVTVADIEGDRERLLEALDGLLRLPEQELEDAEVVEQPPDVRAVRQLFVGGLGALCVRPGEDPLPVALGDERGLEVRLAEGARVVERLGELERALDVLARGFEVAL